jgi:hypothetical protein
LTQAATGLRFACRDRSVGGLLVVFHILYLREIIVNKGFPLQWIVIIFEIVIMKAPSKKRKEKG